jgi:cysteine desulfurase
LNSIFNITSQGGQERGLRSGTLAPALCVGMGEAAKICMNDMDFDRQWVEYLSKKFKRFASSLRTRLLSDQCP